MGEETAGTRAARYLRELADNVEKKSVSYGDSVGKPLRIFSQAGVTDGIRVRIDDKLSRIAAGKNFGQEDTIGDLIGYLALLAVAEQKQEPVQEKSFTGMIGAAQVGPCYIHQYIDCPRRHYNVKT